MTNQTFKNIKQCQYTNIKKHFIDIIEKLKTGENVGFIDLFSKSKTLIQFKYKSIRITLSESARMPKCVLTARHSSLSSESSLSKAKGSGKDKISSMLFLMYSY